MRYTSALVLSTLAVGQVAAINNKHASFHARRVQSEEKRDVDDVDWKRAVQDAAWWKTAVDWSAVDYGNKPAPTPAPAAPSSAAGYKPAVTTPAAAAYTPAPAAASSASKPQSSSKSDNVISNISDKIFSTLDKVASRLSLAEPFNLKKPCDTAWIASSQDSPWQVTFSNTKSEAATVYCFAQGTNGTGQFIKVNKPAIGVTVTKDSPVTISFADNFSGACVPVWDDTVCANPSGYIYNTYVEFTFNNAQTNAGGFDISRLTNMQGSSISAKSTTNGCYSDMENCVFKCTNGNNDCYLPGSYDMFPKGNLPKGCNAGWDPAMKGTGGSCEIPSSQKSEHIQITLS